MTTTNSPAAQEKCPACGEVNCFDHALRTTEPAAQPQGGEPLPTRGCPFCGCRFFKSKLEYFAAPTDGSGNKWFIYRCPKCKAQIALTAQSESGAIVAWNIRADLPRATPDALDNILIESLAEPWICVEEKPCENAVPVHWQEMISALAAMKAPRATGETTVEAGHVLITETDNNTYQRLVDLLLEEDHEPAGSTLDADDILKQIIAERDGLRAASAETTVEACLAKLREMFGDCRPEIFFEANENEAFWKVTVQGKPRDRWYGDSLADCMAQVRAASRTEGETK